MSLKIKGRNWIFKKKEKKKATDHCLISRSVVYLLGAGIESQRNKNDKIGDGYEHAGQASPREILRFSGLPFSIKPLHFLCINFSSNQLRRCIINFVISARGEAARANTQRFRRSVCLSRSLSGTQQHDCLYDWSSISLFIFVLIFMQSYAVELIMSAILLRLIQFSARYIHFLFHFQSSIFISICFHNYFP